MDAQRKMPSTWWIFSKAQSYVAEYQLAPPVRAALYEALAMLPGLTVVTGTRDVLDRPGVAVGVKYRTGEREDMIFDATTHRLLGQRWRSPDGAIVPGSAIKRTAIVDKAGRLP